MLETVPPCTVGVPKAIIPKIPASKAIRIPTRRSMKTLIAILPVSPDASWPLGSRSEFLIVIAFGAGS
jgi:hypothetical protein